MGTTRDLPRRGGTLPGTAAALLVWAGSALVGSSEPAADPTVFDRVQRGMTQDEVRDLLGPPVYESSGDYPSADFGMMWFHCLVAHGVAPTQPGRHPTYVVKFSKDEQKVTEARPFQLQTFNVPARHSRQEIPFFFPDGFMEKAVADLAAAELGVDEAAMRDRFTRWVRRMLPGREDVDEVAARLYADQVMPNLARQLRLVNGEIVKLLRQPDEGLSPGLLVFEGPVAAFRRTLKNLAVGLDAHALYQYFPCSFEKGTWALSGESLIVDGPSYVRRHGEIRFRSIPVSLRTDRAEPLGEFPVTGGVRLELEVSFSGTPVGGFQPEHGPESALVIQPAVTLTVRRTVETGPGITTPSKEKDEKTYAHAPEAFRYRATFKADPPRGD